MMRCKWILLAAVAALAIPVSARADGLFAGCKHCGGGHGGLYGGGYGGGGYGGGNHGCAHAGGARAGHGFFQPPFQAAPWYLYYPYDQHFQMPAPIGAPFFPPQAYAHPAMNTYFPPPVPPVAPIPAPAVVPIPAVK